MVEHIWIEPMKDWGDEECVVCGISRYPHDGKWVYHNGTSIIPLSVLPDCTPSVVHLAHRYQEAQNG